MFARDDWVNEQINPEQGLSSLCFDETLISIHLISYFLLEAQTTFGYRHVVESGNRFHILVVIADGQMEEEEPTVAGRDGFPFT